MFKNVASQCIVLLAIDTATNTPKTGDAANITAYISKDYGTVTVLGDTTATELDATNAPGLYKFDVTQTESNCDVAVFSAKSSTSGIRIVPVTVFMRPANATAMSIDSNGRVDVIKLAGTTCTARDIGAQLDATVSSRMATYTQPTGFLAATFPTTVASTTNITAASGITLAAATHTGAVIPTVTTVTNQLTAAQIATGVWQDTTPGDFTVASSIGKSLYTSGNVPGAASGIALVGSNMGTITGGTITTVSDKTGYSLSASGLSAVTTWTVNVTGSLTGSVGSVSGAVGSVTGNVGGNVTGSVGSVVGAVGSVTGNVGGNVTGSVGSIAMGGIVAASFATDSITSTALAASAVSEIQSGLMTSAGYTAPPSAATISTQVQADLGTGSALTSLASQSSVNTLTAYVDTEVAAILDAVATTGVVLSAAQMNKIADHVLRRQMANVEASSSGDTLSLASQYGAVQQIQESAIVGTTLTVNKTDGTTALGTKTVATASGADAITGIS